MRCFISISLPERIKKEIFDIQEKLPKFDGKLTERENLHLTLKFLGEIDGERMGEIKTQLKKIKGKSFHASINSIGAFSKPFPRIIWLEIKGVEELQKSIDESLAGIFRKEKRFMGHLTVARVKRVIDKSTFFEYLSRMELEKISFKVDKFYLMKSTLTQKCPLYEEIEGYPLI